MSYVTCETKLRTLASANAQLQTDLGVSPFRWFDRRLVQGDLVQGATCVRIKRVSTVQESNQGGLALLEKVRFQIDVLDFDPEVARAVATDIDTFLAGINLLSATPTNINTSPTYKLNQRADMEFRLKPPAYVETLDYRIWNAKNVADD